MVYELSLLNACNYWQYGAYANLTNNPQQPAMLKIETPLS